VKHTTGIVIVVPVRIDNAGCLECLVQRRRSPHDFPRYDGLWEFPQGKLRIGESFQDAGARELREESGLRVLEWYTGDDTADVQGTLVSAIQPLAVSLDHQEALLGIGLVAHTAGDPHDTRSAAQHRWMCVAEVSVLREMGDLFPLDAPLARALLEAEGALTKWLGASQGGLER
jgi:8-oxo-dGTP pyrophosphatase MutT (NUDIX family)